MLGAQGRPLAGAPGIVLNSSGAEVRSLLRASQLLSERRGSSSFASAPIPPKPAPISSAAKGQSQSRSSSSSRDQSRWRRRRRQGLPRLHTGGASIDASVRRSVLAPTPDTPNDGALESAAAAPTVGRGYTSDYTGFSPGASRSGSRSNLGRARSRSRNSADRSAEQSDSYASEAFKRTRDNYSSDWVSHQHASQSSGDGGRGQPKAERRRVRYGTDLPGDVGVWDESSKRARTKRGS